MRSMTSFLYTLEALPADAEVVGSKAANLLDAARRGLPIPPTAVVPGFVYDELVPWTDLAPAEMHARIAALDLRAVGADVTAAVRERFGDIRFAVRSSSNMEDAADRS